MRPWQRWFASLVGRVWLGMGGLLSTAALAQPAPLVLGQSLPLSGPAFPISNRVQAGAKAWVDRVNANGGIGGRRLELLSLDDGEQDTAATLRELAAAAPQALVLNLGPESLELLTRHEAAWRAAVPLTVAALSSPGLTQLTRLLRDRLIGFTSVVPNPEISQLPLVREFERDAEAYVGPEAISLEGLAAYLHLRVCVEALRRAGHRVDGPALASALENLGALDLGGFAVRFSPRQHRGSDHVEIGLRGRDGRLRR